MVVKGRALLTSGSRIALNRLELRIVNPGFIGAQGSRIGKRDIRADTIGGRVENFPGGFGNLLQTDMGSDWKAIHSGLNPTEQQLAVAGHSRAMAWLATNANSDRFGMTIFEAGAVGGLGMGGCPSTGYASISLPTARPTIAP